MKRILLISNCILLLALLLSGLANFFFINKLDSRYSNTLSLEIRGAVLIRSITRDSIQRQRAVTNMLLAATTNPAQVATFRDHIQKAVAKNDLSFRELDDLINDPDTQIKFDETVAARIRYNHEVDKVLALFDEGQLASSVKYKDGILRPIFALYLEKQDNLAEKLENFNGERNIKLSTWSSFFQWISIGLSTWPMILLCLVCFVFIFWSLLIGWNIPDEQA
ncbi:MAG: MCP four helix bundle domain-containing protein [Chthoniobacterales bacterium]